MTNNKARRRIPGEQTEHGQGIKFDTLYDNDYVVGNKLTDEKRAELNENAAEINEAYFDFVTDAYQNGWGNKFHFSGYQPDESWATAAARHEHYLALIMEFKPGMKVLDLGCGVGGPAREMAIFAGVYVTGLTINDLHVERSNELNKQANLHDQVHMVKGTFSDLPFADETFDMVFAIEALCCAPNQHLAYTEALRVLKPGGKIGILDWVITDKYDDSNAEHRMIRGRIERNGAVPHMITPKTRIAALVKAGFEIVREEDRATAKANPIPWWHAIDYKHYPTWYDWSYCVWITRPIYYASRVFINTLYFLGLIPQYGVTASYTVGECVYSCRDGGKLGIFSPMHMFVARKPGIEKP